MNYVYPRIETFGQLWFLPKSSTYEGCMVIKVHTPAGDSIGSVTIDGRDITNDCFEFDADAGWAKVYVKDEHGELILNSTEDGFVSEIICGQIKYTLKTAVA